MIHELRIPDVIRGGDLCRIAWDDETGAIEGDHFEVPYLRRRMAEPPVVIVDESGTLTLNDPSHDVSDFLALLRLYCRSSRLTGHLPESLATVTPTPWVPIPLPDGAVA